MKSEALSGLEKSIMHNKQTWRTSNIHNDRYFDIVWVLLSGIDRVDIEHVEC